MGSTLSTTLRLEEHAFFILFIALVRLVWWYAVWGLLDEFTSYLQKHLCSIFIACSSSYWDFSANFEKNMMGGEQN